MTWPLSPQPPELEQLGRVVELDSDMADITQEPAQEPLAEDALAEEQEAVPASTHIASSRGINPYVLQVSAAPAPSRTGLGRCLHLPPQGCLHSRNNQGIPWGGTELTHHTSHTESSP